MRCFPFLLCLFLLNTSAAQKLLKGVVVDEKNVPIPKASVFLNNTSIGTTADNEGQFSLNIPAGKFELIVSSIGYITHNKSVNAAEVADFLTIQLKIKAPELETVIIEPFEKDGWQKWGRWFNDNFLGTSEYGRECRIKNPEVLKFRNSKKRSELTVIAIAPLMIENKALGYRITYQLENFRFDFKTRYLLYAGYPFFENLEGSNRKKRKWEGGKRKCLLRFHASLYAGGLPQ
ncbi:MAG TPA: carboxypeptidase-like regulatory domain-containing protein [Flavisolibacter sp.]|nr:carboxypeptidase-like regulatory domain-containing protein [Flavisolibacter sp.]